MKSNLLRILGGIAIVTGFAGCNSLYVGWKPEKALTAEQEQHVTQAKDVFRQYISDVRDSKYEDAVKLFSSDAKLTTQDRKPAKGTDAIYKFLTSKAKVVFFRSEPKGKLAPDGSAVVLTGPIIEILGNQHEGGRPIGGQFIAVVRAQPDGKWKMSYLETDTPLNYLDESIPQDPQEVIGASSS